MLSDALDQAKKPKPYSEEGKNWFQKRKGSFIIGGSLILIASLLVFWPLISGADTPSKVIAPGHDKSSTIERGF